MPILKNKKDHTLSNNLIRGVFTIQTEGWNRINKTGFWIMLFLFFGIGCFICFEPDRIPGDLGDARFNMYVLEHGYRWISGIEKNFWDAPFFYPAENVLTYSDSHLGTLPLFAVLREIGMDREYAFLGWMILCSALNYFGAYLVLRKLTPSGWSSKIACLMGAYFFTFGLPMIAQINHAQLIPRFFIPLGFLFLFELLEKGTALYWYAFLLTVITQIYVSIYTGYFLIFCSFFIFIAWIIFNRERILKWSLPRLESILEISWKTFLMGLLLLPLALPYYETSQILGLRHWAEISSMLPRPVSYLMAPLSIMWRTFLPTGEGLPMPHEHALFVGGLPLFAFFYGLSFFREKGNSRESVKWLKVFSTGLIFVILTTIMIGNHSLYRMIYDFPGAGSIRAITRIILVMLFPIAFILAFSVISLLEKCRKRFGLVKTLAVGSLLSCFLVIDQAGSISSFSISESKALIQEIKIDFSNQEVDGILWVRGKEKEPFYMAHLSAMLAAQELGVPTINGYSGNYPPRYPQNLINLGNNSWEALEQWIFLNHNKFGYSFTTDEIVQIGHEENNDMKRFISFLPILGKGFDIWEGDPGQRSWAIGKKATLKIPDGKDKGGIAHFKMDMETLIPRIVTIRENGRILYRIKLEPGERKRVCFDLELVPGVQNIEFATDKESVVPGNGDPRHLSFCIMDVFFRVEEI